MADVSAPRPGSAAALRRARTDALKNNLQILAANHSDVLESLTPDVRMRVEALREIQTKHDGIEAEYLKEKAAVEAKYQKMYEPLYSQRSDIVNGANKEVEADDKDAEVEKGVPDFWLNAMKSNDVLAEEITEDDEGALVYLTDIKCCWIEEPKGFKLDFLFDTNPYFSNAVLTKTYHLTDDVETILEKVIGTEIEWKDGKSLTQKVCKTKRKKGSKNISTTKTEDCKSFFNFFKPPHVPKPENKPENCDDLDEKRAEELQNQMEQDYDIGSTIRDKIIPHAVSWFTGEAAQGEYCEYSDMDDEDNDEDDDEVGGQQSEEDDDEAIKSRNNSPSFKDSEDELNEGHEKDSEEDDDDVDETNKSRKKSRIMDDEDDDEDGDDTDEDGDD